MKYFKGLQKRGGPDDRVRWALMATYDIPCEDGELYLRRLRIVQTPLFGVYLHELHKSDAGRQLHDHPYSFVSIILKGGYRELVPIHQVPGFRVNMLRHWKRWSVHYMPAEHRHRIDSLDKKPTWSLLLVGRRKRVWGFYTSQGWIPWYENTRTTA